MIGRTHDMVCLVDCGFCHGTGKLLTTGSVRAREADGKVRCRPFSLETPCSRCNGTGQVEIPDDDDEGLQVEADECTPSEPPAGPLRRKEP